VFFYYQLADRGWVQNDGGLPAHPLRATCVLFAAAMEAGALLSAQTTEVISEKAASVAIGPRGSTICEHIASQT
jgi:hypothetical protein